MRALPTPAKAILVALPVALLTAGLTTTPAAATTPTANVTVKDAHGDVQDGANPDTPIAHDIDIYKAIGTQTKRTLRVTITVNDVTTEGDGDSTDPDHHQWELHLAKKNGTHYWLPMGNNGTTGSGHKASEAGYENSYTNMQNWSCKNANANANVDTDTVTFTVPLSCLGKPKKIQIGANSQTHAVEGDEEPVDIYTDETSLSAFLTLT